MWFRYFTPADRESVIGGTDLAALCGFSRYCSPIDIWRDKRGLSLPRLENQHMTWGKKLEAIIADHYSQNEEVALHSPEAAGTPCLRNPDLPAWHGGSADRFVIEERRGLEIKTAFVGSQNWGIPGTDEIPIEYLIQCVWYMHVFDCERWDLAVLIGGHDYRKYELSRNLDLEQILIDKVDRFWYDHVLADIPPPLDASDSYALHLENKYTSHTEELLIADSESELLITRLRQIKEVIRESEREKALLINQLKERIGSNLGIISPYGKVTWREGKNGRRFRATFLHEELNEE